MRRFSLPRLSCFLPALAAVAALFAAGCSTDKGTDPKENAGMDRNPVVVMETSEGAIKVELFADKAPATVKNFLSYVDDKHYDGTIFHRVISNFMIQGGGFKPELKNANGIDDIKASEKKTRDPIKNEA